MLTKRICCQNFVEPFAQANYLRQPQESPGKFPGEGLSFEVHGRSSPGTGLPAMPLLPCAELIIRHLPPAQAPGFKAFEIGHLQEPGLQQVTGLFTATAAGGAGG